MAAPLALEVIHAEHQALAGLLRALAAELARTRGQKGPPDFELLRAMVFYISEFPERLHHTKESTLLFPRLRELAPELGEVIDGLDLDHARGEAAVREVEHALLAWEVLGEARRAAFERAVELHTAAYLQHMACEDQDILPAAERLFSEADWVELDAAFAANRDPLTGHEPEQGYRELFRRIDPGA